MHRIAGRHRTALVSLFALSMGFTGTATGAVAPRSTAGLATIHTWPQRAVASTSFSDAPVLANGSSLAFGVVSAGAGQHVYGRLQSIDLATGKVARGPLVFDSAQVVRSGSFLGILEPIAASAGPNGYAAPPVPAYWTLRRIETPTTKLAQGHYLRMFGELLVPPQLYPAGEGTSDFWVAAGARLELIDPLTGSEIRSLRVPQGIVSGLVPSPSRSELYVSTRSANGFALDLYEIDATSGRVRARTVLPSGLIFATPEVASLTGVWIAESGGMNTHFVVRYSSSTLQLAAKPEAPHDGQGLAGYAITTLGGIGWTWTAGTISCVSTTSGGIRAQAATPLIGGNLYAPFPIALIGKTLFASLAPDSGSESGRVVAISPPQACFTGA